jgi:hypothetical protein
MLLLLVPLLVLSASAKDDLAEATRLLKAVQDEQALAVITRALDRGDATPQQTAELCVLLGIARFNLSDLEGSRLAFRRALKANGMVTLPPRAAPKVRALFDEVKAEPVAPEPPPAPPQPPTPTPAPGPVEVVKPAPEPASSLGTRRIAGIAVAGAGLVAGVVGGVLIGTAYSARDQAQAQTNADNARTQFAAAQSQLLIGQILTGASAAILIAGIVLAVWPTSASQVALLFGPSGGALRVKF